MEFFEKRAVNEVLEEEKTLQYEIFKAVGIPHLITTEEFGHIDLDKTETDEKILKALDFLNYSFENPKFVYAGQPHKNEAEIVDGKERIIYGKDALITKTPETMLVIRTSDCLPILIGCFDEKNKLKAVAGIHGSRESLRSGVIKNTFDILKNRLQLNPENFLIAVGPHICSDCYKLAKDNPKTKELTKELGREYFEESGDKLKMNLGELALNQLKKEGAEEKNIYNDSKCTYHQNVFPSYRKRQENGEKGRFNFASVIGLQHP